MGLCPFFCASRNEILLFVQIVPKASSNKICGCCIVSELNPQIKARLKIMTTQPAENGKANGGVIDILSKWFDIPKRDIVIQSGELDRKKTLRIATSAQKINLIKSRLAEII